MRVLVTGANGFLGYYLVELLLRHGHDVIATGRSASRLPFQGINYHYVSFDFTDAKRTREIVDLYKPDLVIHSGAMTRPDDCEVRQWDAYMTNVEGTVNLLQAAATVKAFFVFVSTDFVFDGARGMYREKDERNPVNFYGKTKKEAEDFVQRYPHGWAIARTVLVYGEPKTGGQNVLTILHGKIQKGEKYQLVNDQFRTPTYVGDLARGIVAIAEKKAGGTWHLSGKDLLTPYEMGLQAARLLSLDTSLISPVHAGVFTQAALRPPRTGFVIDKAVKELGYNPVSFDEGLRLSFSSSLKR
jgi:dTDP-4-dehydrorhamnose reductase